MEPISKMVDKIDWKSTKGITLIMVVALLVISTIFFLIPEDSRYLSYIATLVILVAILFFLAPRQTIVIGERSEVGGDIEQDMSESKTGVQHTEVKEDAKVKGGIKQK